MFLSTVRRSLLLASALLAFAVSPTQAWADGGQVVVTPGDFDGQYAPPSIDMSAAHQGGSSSGGASASANHHVGGGGATTSANGGSAPVCTYTPTGIPVAELQTQFAEYQAGPSSGSGSVGYNVTCNGVQLGWVLGDPAGAGGGGSVLPSPGVLAEQAFEELRLPGPVAHHSPDVRLSDGRAATVVGEYTWVWADRGVWVPQHRRVQAGPVWAEVTATPYEFTVSTGLGVSATCVGPGTPYSRTAGLHAASPDCGLIFPRSSYGLGGDTATVTYGIRWHVSWVGSTGADAQGGTLPDMTSQASESLVVAEIQALRSH